MKKRNKQRALALLLCLAVCLMLNSVPIAAAASRSSQPVLQVQNVEIAEGQAYDLTTPSAAETVRTLTQGTIVVRYQSTSEQPYQSLFSVSNGSSGNSDRHFHLYITPDGTLGMELRNTDSVFKYTMAAEGAVTPGINTVAFSADSATGTYRLYSNGALVSVMQKDDYRFFSDITGTNTVSLGGTVREGVVKYPFGGTILQA